MLGFAERTGSRRQQPGLRVRALQLPEHELDASIQLMFNDCPKAIGGQPPPAEKRSDIASPQGQCAPIFGELDPLNRRAIREAEQDPAHAHFIVRAIHVIIVRTPDNGSTTRCPTHPGIRGHGFDGSEPQPYDQVPMAVIEIFRTIPGPKQSWRPLTVVIDDSHRVRIPGAGFETVDVDVGTHRMSVTGAEYASQGIEVDVVADRPTQVLVGPGAGGASADRHRVDIKECTDKNDLPRCLIPLNNPGGLPQTLTQGRNKAWLAFSLMLSVGFGLVGIGTVFLVLASVAVQTLSAVILVVIGAWIVWKLRIVWRSIWNQRRWPMEDWRVNDKVEGSEEWERWISPSPDDSPSLWT